MKKLYATPRKHFEEYRFHGKCPWDLIDIMVSFFFMLLPELVESNTSASMFLLLGAFAALQLLLLKNLNKPISLGCKKISLAIV